MAPHGSPILALWERVGGEQAFLQTRLAKTPGTASKIGPDVEIAALSIRAPPPPGFR
jgi:hypothetical protein